MDRVFFNYLLIDLMISLDTVGLRCLLPAEIQTLVASADVSIPKISPTTGFLVEAQLSQGKYDEEQLIDVRSQVFEMLDMPGIQDHYKMDNYYFGLRILRILAQKFPSDNSIARFASIHSNPNVPWSSQIHSEISMDIGNTLEIDWNNFLEVMKPELLVLPKQRQIHGGLRPRLGYGGAKHEIMEEDARKKWKESRNIILLALIWFMIELGPDTTIPIASSFILNVGGDYEPWIKAQNCHLILKLTQTHKGKEFLQRSGLIGEYFEMTRKALAHIPPITPVNDSLEVLEAGYKSIFQLIELEPDRMTSVDVLNANVLNSILYLLSNRDAFPVLQLLFTQLNNFTKRLDILLISMSRVMFFINQAVTNPYIMDDIANGIKVIEEALHCQNTIIKQFNEQNAHLLFNYRFDLLGVWVVMCKRIERFPEFRERYSGIAERVKGNISEFNDLQRVHASRSEHNKILEELYKELDRTQLERYGLVIL